MSDDKEKATKGEGTLEVSGSTTTTPDNSELLKNLPPEVKKTLEFGMAMHRVGPIPNPIANKLNEGHIDKILELAAKDDERSFNDSISSRRYTLVYVVIFALLFIFSTIFLVNMDKDLYKEILKLFAMFLGGAGSGYGIKSYIDRKK